MPDGQLVVAQSDEPTDIVSFPTPMATRKHFSVALSAGNTRLRFAPSDADQRDRWRFALMSDIQTGVDRVRDMFEAVNAEPNLRFLLGAGDLSQSGTAAELERIQRELEILELPYYTTLGNHDAEPDTPWHALYGRGNFSFRYRGVRFSMLDSAAASIDPLAYDWLDDWLGAGIADVHVFAMHVPALDPVGTRNGGFGSRNEAGKLMAMLADGQVDVTLYGHIHSFYQFENAGIPAFISGGGGAHQEQLDGIGRHFVVVELGADDGVVATQRVEVD
jgi:predicted phosphodiesterase